MSIDELLANPPMAQYAPNEDLMSWAARISRAGVLAGFKAGLAQAQVVVVHVPLAAEAEAAPSAPEEVVPEFPQTPVHPRPNPEEAENQRQRSKEQSDKMFAQLGDLGWDYKSDAGKAEVLTWINEKVLYLDGADQLTSTKELNITQCGRVITALDKEIEYADVVRKYKARTGS